jgi:hypothetical protein
MAVSKMKTCTSLIAQGLEQEFLPHDIIYVGCLKMPFLSA